MAKPAEPKKPRKPAAAPADFAAPAWDRHEGVTATGWSLFTLLDRFTAVSGGPAGTLPTQDVVRNAADFALHRQHALRQPHEP
jgi:hypothetical protein